VHSEAHIPGWRALKTLFEAVAAGFANAALQLGIWLVVSLAVASTNVPFGPRGHSEGYAWFFLGVLFWPILWFVVTTGWRSTTGRCWPGSRCRWLPV
jgi:hypothetical protein